MSKAKVRFRARLSEAQNHRCCYCGVEMLDSDPEHPQGVTIDHYQARSHGGPKHSDNCVAACRACNEQRGTENPQKFWAKKQRELSHAR